ncbi:NitT/TauT family transport system ATP-binding protein [Mumia flava]|uniref:NitT/TauT family transport system ATP-binding protein n=1 Tax=Mumia flava TaxID=1348852 RepID=A0A2M9BGY3_9ACTN|nr:ABC transporter ATP-binding protein [Mumia flava]PJJ57193.1 NitT/TauT family transport system ATP-binding protein [Mumia flava]
MTDHGTTNGTATTATAERGPAGGAVHVADLVRTFTRDGETVHALGPVSLDIEPGEFVALLGPSGCGKSTLLNIIGGLLPPTSGTVRVGGNDVAGVPDGVGMMFQKAVLLAWRTIRENVLLPVEVAGGRRAAKAASTRADELLDLVGLSGFADKMPNELSGGMQQRAAICRMLIQDPEVLLLDEPFGALDEFTREYMNVELARICALTGRTAVFVTHSISEAVFLADRVVVMSARPGRIAGVVDVDLPGPRDPEVMTGSAFQSYVREARDLLKTGYEAASSTTKES